MRYLDLCIHIVSLPSPRYPDAPPAVHYIINWALGARKLFIRHLCLPRPDTSRNLWIEAGSDDRERHYVLFDYLVNPWYVRPTFRRRWGPGALVSRLFGYKIPGDDGDKYHPQGYTFSEVGPHALKSKGKQEMDRTRARLAGANHGGCPFAPLKS